jgi:L-asparaginase II
VKLVVQAVRGGHVEATHSVHAVMVDRSGRVVERLGEPLSTTWRSAAKPFQLEVSLGILPGTDDVPDEQIAVGASSHHAEDLHLVAVRAILARYACTEDDLFCGAHAPGDELSARALIASGAAPTAIHNNCSGKHAFMAATSRQLGVPRDYRSPEHPLQVQIRDAITARSGHRPDVVIDGCGVPCFVLPIDAMARAWAEVAGEMVEGGPLGRIGRCMHAHWRHASGRNATDGALMRMATRPLVAKVGAEGLMCLAVPEAGVGVVVKAETGSDKARQIAVVAVLQAWFPGLLPDGFGVEWHTISNWVGTRCGEWRALPG